MANPQFFKPAFDALAEDDAIGDPHGEPAYAYIRVSSSGQAEEGRSGLPRQIEHIHERALEYGYRIPWDFVFADDHSGFEYETREELTRLRGEFKQPRRRANAVVMEHIDRLSRHATWHQGYLLEEMERHGVVPLFWKEPGSAIERTVLGVIAEQGMRQEIERMRLGTIKKAKSGRITAKVPAFGYKFVDSAGNEGTMEARRDTHYAIDEERAIAVRFMFEGIAYGGMSCYELMNQLDERAQAEPGFRPPRAPVWNERTLVKLLRSPLYKGEYVANRHYREKVVETDEHGLSKTVLKSRERPRNEWIIVPVPAIVDAETWELANRNLYKNKGYARRNKKQVYMLTSIIRCASCGWRYHGATENRPRRTRRYSCSSNANPRAKRELVGCNQVSIHCDILDAAVWEVVADTLLNPEILLDALDTKYSDDRVVEVRKQIAFLKRQIASKSTETDKLYTAYMAGAYTPEEYASERIRVLQERDSLAREVETLESQILTPEDLEEKKRAVFTLIETARASIDVHNAPIELKQRIVRLLVDEIIFNANEGWFEIHGILGTGIGRLSEEAPVAGTSSL